MLSKKSSHFNTVCNTILPSHSMLVSDWLEYANHHLFVTYLYSDQKCEMATRAYNVFWLAKIIQETF